jgi:hypothetical protein
MICLLTLEDATSDLATARAHAEYLRYYNGGLVHLGKAPTPIPAPEKP